jgi:glutamate dehydrogenase
MSEREPLYEKTLGEVAAAIEAYNTGHRYLDEVRRGIFRCALIFIRHTLKTNFFIPEKQALAFRLDPAYLAELGPILPPTCRRSAPSGSPSFSPGTAAATTSASPTSPAAAGAPFSAAAGTTTSPAANTLFRENYVLAHTQHLKNKDIYEGGSKMVVILDAADLTDHDLVTRRLYKLQYGMINAFFDIFVTEEGRAKDPRVVDYYGEDEPIELGPDENMHDEMVELIARQSVRRGYLLGIGVISSKKVGINHKEYGVTSTGVVKFAEIAMEELGIDIRRAPFSVKFTGGPNGDVAGNAMRLMLERCPQAQIRLIVDGTGALFDPAGADHDALRRIVLQGDLDAFDPEALHIGGSLLYRNVRRTEGMRELYKKWCAARGAGGAVGHGGRVLPGVQRSGLQRAGRPLHSGRRAPGNHRCGELAEVLPGGRERQAPGSSSRGQLLHHPGGADRTAAERCGHPARRLRQQVRGHLLLLRDHRQPADEREGVSRQQGALRRRCADDPGNRGRRKRRG